MRLFLLLALFPTILLADKPAAKALDLVKAARSQVGVTVTYDPAYVGLDYPNGDVPRDRGVCTDVVIRALRKPGFDLQKLVHEDMKGNFTKYLIHQENTLASKLFRFFLP